MDYARHLCQKTVNILVLPFEDWLLDLPIGYSEYNGLSVYCFGYDPDELDDEQIVLFCRTIWDNRRGDSDNPTIDADIIVGPRADRYIAEEMDFIEKHYDDEDALIERYPFLVETVYEPQAAFNQRACNFFFAGDELTWMGLEEYEEFLEE